MDITYLRFNSIAQCEKQRFLLTDLLNTSMMTKSRFLSLLALVALGRSFTAYAQGYDDDDIYYNPSKSQKTTKTEKKQKSNATKVTVVDYPAADSYTVMPGQGVNIDVDTYNRRGIFANDTTSVAARKTSDPGSFEYTQQIERFYNPRVIIESPDETVVQYYYSDPTPNINIVVNTPGYWGYSPYYYGSPWYWGTPYTSWRWNYWNSWNAWAYDPWYWGPSWSWSWGGYYPGYWGGYYPGYWGGYYPGYWGPAYRPSHTPGWANRPSGNVRPGASTIRPSHSTGNYRPGSSRGTRPAYGTSTTPSTHYTPGRGTNRSAGSSRSGYTRPSGSDNGSGYRPGSSRSNNSNYSYPSNNNSNRSTPSYRSSGSSRGTGGFGGGHSGGSRGGGGGARTRR